MVNSSGNIISILIADDVRENLSALGKRLRIDGFTILVATDGKQALAIAQNKCPEVVLAKTALPLMNGFELCKAIKKNAGAAEVIFLLLSETEDANHEKEALEAGADKMLSGNYNMGQLVETIHRLCLKKELAAENRPKKVLLVEDNELNQAYISAILQDEGFVIDIVNNGRSALENLQANKYDLVLTDINVPVLNGIELSRIIRAQHSREIPIIAISGHSEKERIDQCLEAGVNTFLVKPFTAKELKILVNKTLHNKKSESPKIIETVYSRDQGQRSYNYNNAIEMAKGDKELLKKWMLRFKEALKNTSDMVNNAIETTEYPDRHSLFHELINYSAYFGLNELSACIHELNSIRQFTDDKERIGNFYRKIKNELRDIQMFYSDIN